MCVVLCLHICLALCAYMILIEAGREHQTPGTEVLGACEPLWVLGIKPRPLKEHLVFLPADLSPEHPAGLFFFLFLFFKERIFVEYSGTDKRQSACLLD